MAQFICKCPTYDALNVHNNTKISNISGEPYKQWVEIDFNPILRESYTKLGRTDMELPM